MTDRGWMGGGDTAMRQERIFILRCTADDGPIPATHRIIVRARTLVIQTHRRIRIRLVTRQIVIPIAIDTEPGRRWRVGARCFRSLEQRTPFLGGLRIWPVPPPMARRRRCH
jgi:hypothetical protein